MNRHVRWIIAVLVLTAVAGLGLLVRSGNVSESPVRVDSGRMFRMGTIARIQIHSSDQTTGQRALQQARQALDNVDAMMNIYRDDSEISKINRLAGQGPVEISQATYRLIEKALDYSRLTDGAFDITVPPLLDLWKQSADENRLPTEHQIADARQHVGWKKVRLSDGEPLTVEFTDKNVRLDLNAIAKGYGIDRAVEAIRSAGAQAALVDIGGDIACFGHDWIVGIQDPFEGTEDQLSQHPRWRIQCRDAAVATSGNYRRYVTIQNRQFSHIVDPRTGLPAVKLPSVTIIAPQAVDADALATAVSVMGMEKGLELIESLPDVEAMLISGDQTDHHIGRSTGFSRYEQTP